MKLVRSWPANPPPHPHVVDDAERVVNDNYDYTGLADLDDDLIHLDWDMAVHREDLETFVEAAKANPRRVIVAPYRIYADSRKADATTDRGRTQWALRRYVNGRQSTRICDDADEACHLFGFGMLYLPREIIGSAAEEFRGKRILDDITFAQWHHLNVREEAPITWQIRPVHLHYRISTLV